MMQYNDLLLKHFDKPSNIGLITEEQKKITLIKAGSPAQGEWVRFYCDIQDNIINNIKFKAYGNPYIIAGASYLAETLLNQAIADITLDYQKIIKLFAIPKTYYHSAIVLDDALNQLKQLECVHEFHS